MNVDIAADVADDVAALLRNLQMEGRRQDSNLNDATMGRLCHLGYDVSLELHPNS